MTGVQLIGTKAVVQRYEKLSAESWALFQGRQFLVGGVGSQDLQDWVKDFETAGSTATYTLRVYDSPDAPTSSTANSDYIACINFKAVDEYEGHGIAGYSNKVMERIKGLEERLKEADGDDKEDDGPSLGDIVTGWLTDPQKLGMVIGAVRQLFGPASAVIPAPPLQTISGMQPVQTEAMNQPNPMNQEESLKRIADALDILAIHDLDLVVHLEKLAKLAQSDQLLFKAIISKLDAL